MSLLATIETAPQLLLVLLVLGYLLALLPDELSETLIAKVSAIEESES